VTHSHAPTLNIHVFIALQLQQVLEIHTDISERAAACALEQCEQSPGAAVEALTDIMFKRRIQVGAWDAIVSCCAHVLLGRAVAPIAALFIRYRLTLRTHPHERLFCAETIQRPAHLHI